MRFCELETILLRDINIELQQQSKHCDLFVKQSDIRNLRRNKQINFHEFWNTELNRQKTCKFYRMKQDDWTIEIKK